MAGQKQYPARLLKEFWADDSVWGDDGSVDDLVIVVNGVANEDSDISSLLDTDLVSIKDGYIFRDAWDEAKSLARVFSGWLKKKRTEDHVSILIQVDKSELGALKEAIAHIQTAKVVAGEL